MIKRLVNRLEYKMKEFRRTCYVASLKYSGKSDYKRWSKTGSLFQSWNQRTKLLSNYILPKSVVLEFGAARLALKSFLPGGCTYYHSDIVARNDDTIVLDLNKELPELPQSDYVVFSGVLEYVKDVERVLVHCSKYTNRILFSYATTNAFPAIKTRRVNGWISDLSEEKLKAISDKMDFDLEILEYWKNQTLYALNRR